MAEKKTSSHLVVLAPFVSDGDGAASAGVAGILPYRWSWGGAGSTGVGLTTVLTAVTSMGQWKDRRWRGGCVFK